MKNLLLMILIAFTFSISINAQNLIAEKYLQIKPVISTREDVEKNFGKGEPRNQPYSFTYRTKEGIFHVNYSDGNCSTEYEDWNISEWTVKRVFMVTSEDNMPRIKEVILDLSKFKKRYIGDVFGQVEFSNEEFGISVTYFEEEKTVQDIRLDLNSAQKKLFACRKNK